MKRVKIEDKESLEREAYDLHKIGLRDDEINFILSQRIRHIGEYN